MGDMNISPHHCGEHYWLLRKFRDHFGYALDAAGGGQGDYDMHDQAGSFASWVGLRRVVQEPRARLSMVPLEPPRQEPRRAATYGSLRRDHADRQGASTSLDSFHGVVHVRRPCGALPNRNNGVHMHRFQIAVCPTLISMCAALSMSCAVSVDPEELEYRETEAASAALAKCPVSDPSCGSGGGQIPEHAPPDSFACGPYRTATLVATPSTVKHGESTTLQWSVTFSRASCIPPVIRIEGQAVAAQGSMVVTPLATKRYFVVIGEIPVVPQYVSTVVTVVLPDLVRIKGNNAEWKSLLIQAVGEELHCPVEVPPLPCEQVPRADRPGRTVLLAHDLDMDLTGSENIHISQGVTLTSELPAAGNAPQQSRARLAVPIPEQRPVARSSQRLGPRLYTRSRPKPLFHIQCNGENIFGDRARVSGFRLQGPHFDIEEGDDNTEKGIMVTSCTGVDISNMEISGWSGQGIYVHDPVERITGEGTATASRRRGEPKPRSSAMSSISTGTPLWQADTRATAIAPIRTWC